MTHVAQTNTIGDVVYKYYNMFRGWIYIHLIYCMITDTCILYPYKRMACFKVGFINLSNTMFVWYILIFIVGFITHLATQAGVPIPPDSFTYCRIAVTVLFSAFLCSTLLIIAMTFDRFYSIIRPHKAASFNSIKRTKFTIISIVTLSFAYNIPHLFITDYETWQCLPYGKAMTKSYGLFYYWFSFVVNFVLPFVSLLCMNSVIIHKIRQRSSFVNTLKTGQQHTEKNQGIKTSDAQLFAILLLVTFAFLVLTTPGQLLFLFLMVVDFFKSAKSFAGYYLFYSAAQKLHFTNHGINFFLYVMSGQKFRTDLKRLFNTRKKLDQSSQSTTNTSQGWLLEPTCFYSFPFPLCGCAVNNFILRFVYNERNCLR